MKKLSYFISFIKPHSRMFAADMILSLLIAIVDLVFPMITRWSMQALLPQRLFTTFFVVMAILFFAYILKGVFFYFVTVIGHKMGTLVEADMRVAVFTHMQKLSFSYYDKNRTGVLLGRVTNDLFEIVELAHHGPENVLTCTVTIVGAIVILLTVNPILSLLLLIMFPLAMLFTMKARKAMQDANIEVKKETGAINAAIESSISGIRTSKAFANEKAEEEKFIKSNEQFKKARVGFYKAMGKFGGGMEVAVGLMQVVVIAAGGFFIMKGSMDFVDLITFSLYVATFTSPIRKMAQFMEIYSQGMAGFDRFMEIMDTKPQITDAEDALVLKDVKGHITYENVSFSYDDGTEVLSGVNMEIKPGQKFAFVGPSGEGKTTLCHLLMRFYDVTGGCIRVDGHDIRKVTQESLHRNIGLIAQDVFMFAGTVMENIRYGRPDATDAEVIRAAKLAHIHDEIEEMPQGYDSFIGERGVVLSGGQKQRVAIARVFLKNPPVLILDEATSALDTITEQQIQESLDMLSTGRTCITIAHRLSTIRNSDCIAVIEEGKIPEMGSREELLRLGGKYASLEQITYQD